MTDQDDLQLGQEYGVQDFEGDRLRLSAALFGEGDLAPSLTVRVHAPDLRQPQRTLIVFPMMAECNNRGHITDVYGVRMGGVLPFKAENWVRIRITPEGVTACIQDHPPVIEF